MDVRRRGLAPRPPRLCRGHHLRRLNFTSFQGATLLKTELHRRSRTDGRSRVVESLPGVTLEPLVEKLAALRGDSGRSPFEKNSR